MESTQEGLIHLRRQIHEPDSVISRYLAQANAMTTRDDLLCAHAIPGDYWIPYLSKGTKQEAVTNANKHFRELIQDPFTLLSIVHGENPALAEDVCMVEEHKIRHPAATLVWRTFGDETKWKEEWKLPLQAINAFGRQGWAGLLRGHDTQAGGPRAHVKHGFTVVNGDGGMWKPSTLACHVRVLKDGRIVALRDKA